MFVPYSSRIAAKAVAWNKPVSNPLLQDDWFFPDQLYLNLGYNLVWKHRRPAPTTQPVRLRRQAFVGQVRESMARELPLRRFFISYSHIDEDFIEPVVQLLRATGAPLFRDQDESAQDRGGGQNSTSIFSKRM